MAYRALAYFDLTGTLVKGIDLINQISVLELDQIAQGLHLFNFNSGNYSAKNTFRIVKY